MEFRIEQYCYRVRWSAEDEEFVGTVAEFPSLSWLDGDQEEAFRGIVSLVREVVSDMREDHETVPEPLSLRSYSGNIRLRMPPEQHRELTMLAAEEGVSLNRLICSLVGQGMQGSQIRKRELTRLQLDSTLPTLSPSDHEATWEGRTWNARTTLTVVEGGGGNPIHSETHRWGEEM